MKTALTKDRLGIVLNMEPSTAGADEVPFSAHFILNRCLIDDDGNICLTAQAGLLDVLDLVDMLKAELDGLANEAVLWFAQGIALDRSRIGGIANDNGRGPRPLPRLGHNPSRKDFPPENLT